MKIGILSKRKHMFAGRLKELLASSGHQVDIITLDDLKINRILLDRDFYVLKSKKLFFLYAGYFLMENQIPVIPDPKKAYRQKDRIQAHKMVQEAGLKAANFFYGTLDAVEKKLIDKDFPLLIKPLMGSGSKGVHVIENIDDFHKHEIKQDDVIYGEKLIFGIHYNVYFLGDNICTLIKKPLKNEHSKMTLAETPDDIRNVINQWKNKHDILFGHLDIIREKETDDLYVVDPGAFPEFSNWQCEGDVVQMVCDLILKRYQNLK